MLYLALLPVLIWLYLALARGGFWRVSRLLSTDAALPAVAARVVAVIPARNEAPVIGAAVRSLLAQQFAGELHIVSLMMPARTGRPMWCGLSPRRSARRIGSR